jgi:hypothetical protein
MGQLYLGVDPGQKQDPARSASLSSAEHCVSRVPGLRPVLVKGSAPRRSAPLTKLTPLSPRLGCG